MRRTTALSSLWKAETKSGENFSFENCKGGYFSVLDDYGLKVVGNIDQELLTGKNLLDERRLSEQTERGITSYWDDSSKTIQVKGTTTDYYMRYFLNNTPAFSDGNIQAFDELLEDGETYILLFQRYGEYEGLSAMGQYTEKATGKVGYLAYGTPFTVDKSKYTYDWFRLQCSAAGKTWDCKVNLQLSKASDGEDYEPYCGGVPAPNVDYPKNIAFVKAGTKITCCGKNLLDESRLSQASVVVGITSQWDEGTKSIHVQGTSTGYFLCYFLHNTPPYAERSIQPFDALLQDGETYVLLFNRIGQYQGLSAMGQYTEKATGKVGYLQYGTPFTVDKSKYTYDWFRLQCPAPGTTLDCRVNLQLAKLSQGRDYEPFVGNEILTPCDLYPGDIWYPMTGQVVHQMSQMILDGTESVMRFLYGDIPRFQVSVPDAKVLPVTPVQNTAFSNYFKSNTYNGVYAGKGGISLSYQSPRLTFNSPQGQGIYDFSAEEVAAWLKERYDAGEPMIAIYELAEPWTEHFDPQPIAAPRGWVNVLQTPTEIPGNLEATMMELRHRV